MFQNIKFKPNNVKKCELSNFNKSTKERINKINKYVFKYSMNCKDWSFRNFISSKKEEIINELIDRNEKSWNWRLGDSSNISIDMFKKWRKNRKWNYEALSLHL